MDHRGNRHNAQSQHTPNGNRFEYADENVKKKSKKWSLGGLFKRRRNKSSDTDSSSDTDCRKKGFLHRSQRRKGGSHRVVGKFEAKMIKDGDDQNSAKSNFIEKYDASPSHVIKNRLGNGVIPPQCDAVEVSGEMTKGSCSSLDTTNRRQMIKARAVARRVQQDDTSSSDEYTSSKTSNCSLQRSGGDPCRTSANSLSRKSRASRTDRYLRRHLREDDGRCCSNSELVSTPVGSPKNRWVAKVIYQHSSDYLNTPQYSAHTQSATCSPLNSPTTCKRSDYSSSLPSKHTSDIFRTLSCSKTSNESHAPSTYRQITSPESVESLPKISPPPPPPRNPHRKITYPPGTVYSNRPSSYAFDAHTQPSEISAYVSRPIGYKIEPENVLRLKSSSDMELQNEKQLQIKASTNLQELYPTQSVVRKYCADRKPRSRNPIYIVNDKENIIDLENAGAPLKRSFTTVAAVKKSAPHCTPLQINEERHDSLPLSKANEIGIPVSPDFDQPINVNGCGVGGGVPKGDRPLSIVSEKSDELLDNEVVKTTIANTVSTQNVKSSKPTNLEEALVELEEIYNSLKLSDEDLLDRAERRDLQSALRMNPNFTRYSWSDLDSSDKIMDCSKISSAEYLSSGLLSPRLPCGRRSAVPDTIADDMAHRKLCKKDTSDPKTTSSIVSQSGSFLLVSPALSPPPLVNIPPAAFQVSKEPDITLDDVVYRNIRQANSTLKALDPQPPFGIPIGPVSPAANSDYLHAVPGEKYRSTFNPSRTPDVVKDDLAFRNLRRDVNNGQLEVLRPQFAVPSVDAKKRRAIRSLSANVVSLLGGAGAYSDCFSLDNENSGATLVDVNGNSIAKTNRCASYNDLPDVLENLNVQKRALLRNCNECLGSQSRIANEAKILRLKLRELEAIPPPSAGKCGGEEEKNVIADSSSTAPSKEIVVRRVALHKPITLNQFTIGNDATSANSNVVNVDSDMQQCSDKLATLQSAPVENNVIQTNSVGSDEVSTGRPKNLCEKLRWNSVKTMCSQYQPKRVILGECDDVIDSSSVVVVDLAVKTDVENSSSGVSSTSETPDPCRKSTNVGQVAGAITFHNDDGDDDKVNPAGVAGATATPTVTLLKPPSLSNACEQFAKELDTVDGRGLCCTSLMGDGGGVTAASASAAVACACNEQENSVVCSRMVANSNMVGSPSKRHEHCSRIEIRLSTPEPEGSR